MVLFTAIFNLSETFISIPKSNFYTLQEVIILKKEVVLSILILAIGGI